jgi:hypothetical protein
MCTKAVEHPLEMLVGRRVTLSDVILKGKHVGFYLKLKNPSRECRLGFYSRIV